MRERVMRWLSAHGTGTTVATIMVASFALTQVTNFNASDVLVYEEYARAFWLGDAPFRALPLEYPPFALAPFAFTLFPAGAGPFIAFGLWMGGFALLVYLLLAWGWSRRVAIAFGVYLVVGGIAVALSRYDLVPVAFTVAAWLAAERKRFVLAYMLLAGGVLLKLYPLFLFPLFALAHWRSLQSLTDEGSSQSTLAKRWLTSRRIALSLVAPVAAMLVPFGIVGLRDLRGALSALTFAQTRLIEVESIPATLLWAGTAFGFPAYRVFSYAYNYAGPLDGLLRAGSSLAMVLGLLWVYWRMARGALELPRAILAALCVILVTGKVLSAQYLLWILPFIAVVYELDLLWLAICALTTLEYPILLAILSPSWGETYDPVFLGAVALRNALLVVAAARIIMYRAPDSSASPLGEVTGAVSAPQPAGALP